MCVCGRNHFATSRMPSARSSIERASVAMEYEHFRHEAMFVGDVTTQRSTMRLGTVNGSALLRLRDEALQGGGSAEAHAELPCRWAGSADVEKRRRCR